MEDAFGIGGPGEGPWIRVCFCDEAVDCRFEIADGAEHAALETPSRELGEGAFDGIEPRGRSRREVQGPARMSLQPFADFGMFVSGIVVDDGMDRLAFGDLSVDEIEGGEQGRGAVALVVMRHRAGAAGLERQAWLGAVEGLDLALLVDREDDGMRRRIDVEANNVLEFVSELR